jgi:hypothetical protein
MRCVSLLVALSSALAYNATLIWQQSEQISIYNSAAIARHANSPPTFATATDLNNPIYVEVFNVSDPSGSASWSFPDPRQGASWTVVMARHTEGQAADTPVDTVGLDVGPSGDTTCAVYAWSSLGSGVPVWFFNKSSCQPYSVAISDDGSTVAISAALQIGQPKLAPVLWLLDAQTGVGASVD